MPRPTITAPIEEGPKPFIPDPEHFVSSGSTLFNLMLGGGWAQGRVVNLVGDRSTGKTLLAIEAAANFAKAAGNPQRIRYAEAESAFDEEYAQTMGLPQGIQIVRGLDTVEQLNEDIGAFMKGVKAQKGANAADFPDAWPGLLKASGHSTNLYVLDSLDSLSDEAELEREIDAGSYGGAKAKKMSELFRRNIRDMGEQNCTMMVISQIRDRIGVMFGETKTRSGGKALDFYASQIVWLAEIGKIKRTYKNVERVIGLEIAAKNKKNKKGPAYREVRLELIFGYGIDDEASMLNWLDRAKAAPQGNLTTAGCRTELGLMRRRGDRAGVRQLSAMLQSSTAALWHDIDEALAPPMSKYGD